MKSKKLHLSLLMFFQLAVLGSYVPILSIYLKDYLHFSSIQVGVILSIASIPSIIAPFFSAWIVDRLITSRKFLALCHTIAAILILFLSVEKSYFAVLVTYFIYTILIVPTFALVNTLVFHNMIDRNSFGSIRLWGTVGWIAAGLFISFVWKIVPGEENMSLALQFSAIFSIIVIVLTLKLPKLKLDRDKKVTLIPYESFKVLKNPKIWSLFIFIFISATADKFMGYGLPMFLNFNGVKEDNIMIIMSIGQFTEIFMLFALSSVIKKLGFKKIFSLGLLFQLIRFTLFLIDGPVILTILGISLHGFIYAFFFAAATIYLDKSTNETTRGGMHQLFTLASVGLAGLIGNLAAGFIAQNFQINGNINFRVFWSIPVTMCLISLLTLTFFIKRKQYKIKTV